MPDCVLSAQNRFYVLLEPSYGAVPGITASERIPAIRLRAQQELETRPRRDKVGGRTYAGVSPGGRKRTEFSLQTYLVSNATPSAPPAMGPLVEASLGDSQLSFAGGTAGSGSTASQIVFSSSHGLTEHQAFGFGGELRFVATVVDSTTVQVNAPFSAAPGAGQALTAAVTYFPANALPSVSIFDYWDPAGAVDRILVGASCNRMQVKINADYHEIEFIGEAQDILDSVSFSSGQGGLGSFPTEPAVSGNTGLPIPGNLGQAWLGTPANKFLTVANALVEIDNDIDLRSREFGTSVPQCVTAGVRRVIANFELFEMDDDQTRDLYAAARTEAPISVMFQLGEASGQLMGAFLPQVVPQVPEFRDDERILKWNFGNSRAQGLANDDVIIAFG